MNAIKIGHFSIAKRGKPFIIAEAGINHNGELEKAYAMIKIAKSCGTDAIKFQTFKAEEFINDPAQMFSYYSQGKQVKESMLEMFKRYEFSADEWVKIKRKCDEEKVLFLSTPQNISDLKLLLKLGMSAIKVGSDDFTNLHLLKEYKKAGLPIILSCGMADLGEIYYSLEAVGAFDSCPVILLYCVSLYPTAAEDANLLRLKTLSRVFPNLILGFSDHTQGILASALAVGMGAMVFEKHFTLDKRLPGPDHWFSEDPQGLKEWVDAVRTAHLMLGQAQVRPTAKEITNKKDFCRIIVAAKAIEKNQPFKLSNITMKRVAGGQGVSAAMYEMFLKQKAARSYKKGDVIGF